MGRIEEEGAFDLCVIGAGPGGYVAAIRAAQLGKKVALIEKRDTLGGTCLNVGCIPSKALLESSEKYAELRAGLAVHGIRTGAVELDLGAMMARKDAIVKEVTGGLGLLMKKNRITVLQGEASFLDPQRVELRAKDGARREIVVGELLLATGSEAVELPFLPFDGQFVLSSTEALSLTAVPRHLVVIGAGAVGLELGSVWHRLGARVTVVEMLPQVAPFADSFVAKVLEKALKKQGIELALQTRLESARLEANAEWPLSLTLVDGKGQRRELLSDRVLVAVGRRPFTGGLSLDQAGLTTDKQGRIPVNERYQTSIPHISAIGDLTEGPMLAHKAQEEGIAVAELLAGLPGHVSYDAIPSVIYTHPELASVGLGEDQAVSQGLKVKTGRVWLKSNARARTLEADEGVVKVVADAETDRILGVHVVAPRASDMIAEAVIAMEFKGSAEDLARSVHAHPTLSELLKEAALSVDGRALHG